MPVSFMAEVVIDGIACQQSAHEMGKTGIGAAQKNVGVITQQCPGINTSFCFCRQITEALYKIFTIILISDNVFFLNSTYDNVMQCTGSIQACLSWHFCLQIEIFTILT